MKNTHKSKVYRFDTKILKNTYLDFKKQMLPQKFEKNSESRKPQEILLLQQNIDEESNKSNIFNVTQLPQLNKYLIYSYITDSSSLLMLNRIEQYLDRKEKQKKTKTKQEEEKTQKNHSQITEVRSLDKVA